MLMFTEISEKEKNINNDIVNIIIKSWEEGYSEEFRESLKLFKVTHDGSIFKDLKRKSSDETLKLLEKFEASYKDIFR